MTDDPAIRVRGLRKTYGDQVAVEGLDLDVARGECFALLGPHGAGKTTTVEILEGYRPRTGGEGPVPGLDPPRPPRGWPARGGTPPHSPRQVRDRTAPQVGDPSA